MKALQVGQLARKTRVFSAEDVRRYAQLTGDESPLYFNSKKLVVPQPLIGGLFSDLLGTELPGRGTNWMKQKFRFLRFAEVGEPCIASVEVVRLRPEKQLVNLQTVCTTARGDRLCEGEALVMAREML